MTSEAVKRKLFNSSPTPVEDGKKNKIDIPTANWGVEEVCHFLYTNELGDVASVFREQHIDGRALLMLTEDRLQSLITAEPGIFRETKVNIIPVGALSAFAPGHQQVFNDPIHGHVEVHPLCVRIIDTPQFQRLRHINQLGSAYYVFPGATNKRFEHSLGVSHLAGQLVRILRNRQPELHITEVDILCVEIAGLCHDLGHGPLSHAFDGTFMPKARPGFHWRHEQGSADMFDHLVEANNLKPAFMEVGLNERDLVFIKEQITGYDEETGSLGRGRDKQFLYEIVANKRSGIDVDKWDYFARDCHTLGIKNNFDHQRFMKFVRVIEMDGEKHICSREKEVFNIYDMFYTRSCLHRRAYQHRVSNIIDHMFTDVLLEADPYIELIGSNGRVFRISSSIEDMEAYTKLTDEIFYQIRYSPDPRLAKAQALLKRIEVRDLYPYVGQGKKAEKKGILTKKQRYSMRDLPELREDIVRGSSLRPEDVVLDLVSVDYGMKDEDPIQNVLFYRKNDNTKALTLRKEDIMISGLLPVQFADQCLRMFVKDQKHKEEATQCFSAWCERSSMTKQMSIDKIGVGFTPYKGQGHMNEMTTLEENSGQLGAQQTPDPFRTPE